MTAQETLRVRVARKHQEAQDIASFELERVDGEALPPFSAGSHIDVHLPASAGGLVRQYSLCNPPHEQHRYRIAVLRDAQSRGGSAGMHDQVHEGDEITISTPRNHFALHPAGRTLLVAGGIGVTPLLCMAQRLAATQASFALHYCTRSRERTAFAQEIAASPLAAHTHFHYDDGDASQKLDLLPLLMEAGDDARLYVCGPSGFIDHVVQTAKNLAFPEDRIHLEYFGAAPTAKAGDGSFEVRIASSGLTCTVPAGVTVVEALREKGVDIMTACEQGVCGTCITRVLEGEVDHRDMYLTEEERACNDQFTPCCSRARSAVLVLDL